MTGLVLVSSAASAYTGSSGGIFSSIPERALDTRHAIGISTTSKLAPYQTVTIPYASRHGLSPAEVSAVQITVTVTESDGPGFVTAFPAGTLQPTASTINYRAGETRANTAIIQTGATTGAITIAVGGSGSTHVIVDITGDISGGPGVIRGGLVAIHPTRMLDTRSGNGPPAAPVAGLSRFQVQAAGRGPVPAGVSAVSVNLTVVGASGPGYISLSPTGQGLPEVSNINYAAGETVANAAMVKVGWDGRLLVTVGGPGVVDVLIDVTGYVPAGSPPADTYGFVPIDPQRMVDTRDYPERLDTRATNLFTFPPDVHGVDIPQGSLGVVVNVTATDTEGSGYLTFFNYDFDRPQTSNLNFVEGQTVAVMAIVPLSHMGDFDIYLGGNGSTEIVIDVMGYVQGFRF